MNKLSLVSIIFLSCILSISGCSFSTSSKHSSKSSSSPSRSSSGDGEESVQTTTTSLQEEVETLAILYVGSSGTATDFQRELGQIAKGHGIVDWESQPQVFSAIGRGIKRTGVGQDSLASLPFLHGLKKSLYYQNILKAY